MRRSVFEMYIDILKVLAQHDSLNLTHIMYRANVNCSLLKKYLDFLIKQNLVEKRPFGKRRFVYTITERGLTALKQFRELEAIGILPSHVPFVIIRENKKEK